MLLSDAAAAQQLLRSQAAAWLAMQQHLLNKSSWHYAIHVAL
jgi:hypothetical protein